MQILERINFEIGYQRRVMTIGELKEIIEEYSEEEAEIFFDKENGYIEFELESYGYLEVQVEILAEEKDILETFVMIEDIAFLQ